MLQLQREFLQLLGHKVTKFVGLWLHYYNAVDISS